jgi:hypothetical protein
VWIGERELKLFALLYGKPGTPPSEAELPLVHSREVLSVLGKLTGYGRRLRDLGDDVYFASMFNEKYAQTDGTIRRQTKVPAHVGEWIASGPHLCVANPFYKSARVTCRTHRDYDAVDLTSIPGDYLPRSNYFPAVPPDEYERRTPRFRGRPVTDYYRHAHRRMLGTGERTVTATVIPPGAAHIHTIVSAAFSSTVEMLGFGAFAASLVVDFYIRSKGSGDLTAGTMRQMPLPEPSPTSHAAMARYARLVCCTEHYAELWAVAPHGIPRWSLNDERLSTWPDSGTPWSMSTPLRNPFERRQGLVELDVLAAIDLGLDIDQVCTIYRSEFAVLRQFEADTWYDSAGRIAFTSNVNLGVGLDRKDFELWLESLAQNKPLPDGFDTQGLEPFDDPDRPFDLRDREKDMRHAYAFFVKELGLKEPT